MDGISRLNNQGIHLLRELELVAAFDSFAQALAASKEAIEEFSRGKTPWHSSCLPGSAAESESTSLADNSASTLLAPLDLCYPSKEAAPKKELLAAVQDKSVCWKIMKMVVPQQLNIEEEHFCLLQVSFACVYNLALAHHVSGLVLSSRLHLRKALRLYEQAHGLLVHNHTIKPRSENTALYLTVLNNMARLHNHLGDISTQSRLADHILSTLLCMVDVRVAVPSSQTSSLSHDDLEGEAFCIFQTCISNVMHLMLQDVTAPAA